MVAARRAALREDHGIDLAYAGLVRRGRVAVGDHDAVPDDEAFSAGEADEALDQALGEHGRDLVVVDVTAAETSGLLLRALGAGASVVTANKVPLTQDYETFWAMVSTCWKTGARLGYECTVGAALPVIEPLRAMVRAGDEVSDVRGALSGTLGLLASSLDRGEPFSEAVRAAHAGGFTEPDPRDDLGGMDVARKAVILARTLGRVAQMDEVPVESLVPPDLADLPVGEFLDGLADAVDGPLAAQAAAAAEEGLRLRYLATVDAGGVRVGLEPVPAASAFGGLSGPDNRVEVSSTRYGELPLVIQGPGAGVACTAGGVLEDVLRGLA
jgi:homoserine dehydrogenase